MALIPPSLTPERLLLLQAACQRSPQGFARFVGVCTLSLVLVFGLLMGVALLALVWGLQALMSPQTQFEWLGVVAAILGVYVLVTGCLALRPSPERVKAQALSRERAPKLFHLLDKVALKAGVRLPQEVLLGSDMQVHVLRHARLGFLGWHGHSLVLGLPVMLTLDVKQLASVVAHELSHMGRTHGRLGCWAHAMRITWTRLATQWGMDAVVPGKRQLIQYGPAGWLLRYVFPHLNARALVLSRYQAFAADKVARRVAGTQATMDALVRLSVQSQYLTHAFWPEVLGRASHAPVPNVLPYRAMIQRLCTSKAHPKANTWLKQALLGQMTALDTHPPLRERLARAKLSPRLPKAPSHAAAQLLMRDALDSVVVEMDVAWQREVSVTWAELHREYLAQHHLERELQTQGERGALHPDDHLLWARAALKTQGDAASEALLRLMLIDHADDINARFELGSLLINSVDAAQTEGATLLRALALSQDHPHALKAALRYGEWLALSANHEDASFWPDEIRRIEHRAIQAQEALLDFEQEHTLTAPDLSPRCLRLVRELLTEDGVVQQAHWVSKRVASFPEWRYAVLVVSLVAGQSNGERAGELQSRLDGLLQSMGLPIALRVVDVTDPVWRSGGQQAVLPKLLQVPGTDLFSTEAEGLHSTSTPNRYMPA
ncbi:MAG: M48 family metallopeptidase [Burkholderiales bacterium]